MALFWPIQVHLAVVLTTRTWKLFMTCSCVHTRQIQKYVHYYKVQCCSMQCSLFLLSDPPTEWQLCHPRLSRTTATVRREWGWGNEDEDSSVQASRNARRGGEKEGERRRNRERERGERAQKEDMLPADTWLSGPNLPIRAADWLSCAYRVSSK